MKAEKTHWLCVIRGGVLWIVDRFSSEEAKAFDHDRVWEKFGYFDDWFFVTSFKLANHESVPEIN